LTHDPPPPPTAAPPGQVPIGRIVLVPNSGSIFISQRLPRVATAPRVPHFQGWPSNAF
jgi:hypothetical protein